MGLTKWGSLAVAAVLSAAGWFMLKSPKADH
jgi:hypothetical protein